MKGFNNILPLTISLLDSPEQSGALAGELLKLQPEDKVLRWPAGTGGKDYRFDRKLTDRFKSFAISSGVTKLTLVVNQNDLAGFLETYKILSQSFEIVLVEFDNENYLLSHMKKSMNGFREWVLFSFQRNNYIRLKAQQYKSQFKAFEKFAKANGITAPLGYCIDVPDNYRNSIWFEELKDLDGYPIVHVYGQPTQGNYFKLLKQGLDKLKEYDVFITEYSPIHFGDNMNASQNDELELSPKYFEMKRDLEALFALYPNIKLVQHHCLFDFERENYPLTYYRRFTIQLDNKIIDEYER